MYVVHTTAVLERYLTPGTFVCPSVVAPMSVVVRTPIGGTYFRPRLRTELVPEGILVPHSGGAQIRPCLLRWVSSVLIAHPGDAHLRPRLGRMVTTLLHYRSTRLSSST